MSGSTWRSVSLEEYQPDCGMADQMKNPELHLENRS